MKHICIISLLCSFSTIIIAGEGNLINPWDKVAEIEQKGTIKSAYFNFQGTSIITCSDTAARVFDISSQKQVGFGTIKAQMVCLNPSEKFLIINSQCTIDGNPSNSITYGPYKSRTNDHHQVVSCLPVTPHRCVVQKYGPQQELAGITTEPIHGNGGYCLQLYNVSLGKITREYYHLDRIKDFCFHPDKNIVASIISLPYSRVCIWHTEKEHRFPEKEYKQELHSIRFDDTGNRLAVAGEEIIEVLDVTNPSDIKTIISVNNAKHGTQACLSGKWLAIATQSGITLFDIEAENRLVNIDARNNLSPMNCFDATGNLLLYFSDKTIFVYKKTEPKKTVCAPHKETAVVTGSGESSEECCQAPYQKQIMTTLASMYAFIENKFFDC